MKKGQGSLIAWVLLIGFAVTLAVFVSRWSIEQARESTEGVEEMIMGDIQCADIAISGSYNDGSVTNRGTLLIHELIINGKRKPLTPDLMPKEKRTVFSGSDCDDKGKIKILPIIYIDNKKVGCSNKEITLNCVSP